MIRAIVAGLVAVLVVAAFGTAMAQGLTVAVPLDRAEFVWEHPDPTTVVTWQFDCGSGPVFIPVAEAPSLKVPLTRVVTQPGSYTCRLRAVNEFGASEPSNEVSFRAGFVPAAPNALRVVIGP